MAVATVIPPSLLHSSMTSISNENFPPFLYLMLVLSGQLSLYLHHHLQNGYMKWKEVGKNRKIPVSVHFESIVFKCKLCVGFFSPHQWQKVKTKKIAIFWMTQKALRQRKYMQLQCSIWNELRIKSRTIRFISWIAEIDTIFESLCRLTIVVYDRWPFQRIGVENGVFYSIYLFHQIDTFIF